ncbi:hypothetical protein FOA43_000650 [Brettanomyces nanus]|uniref:Peptide chain release factor 1, mitochondrial n=1 Tax=Eeniella nana TaxID=13502 RepID=A0A875RN86_EENNA|nr:uncharacterized protein FOA43_000650 [Brettanomyces nanus]QPG73340.1 hypothetical protein FOA43_000650 [Brettanomyces nanus]
MIIRPYFSKLTRLTLASRNLLVRAYAARANTLTEEVSEEQKVNFIHPALIQKASSLRDQLKKLEARVSTEKEFNAENSKRYSQLSSFDGAYQEYLENRDNYNELKAMLCDEENAALQEDATKELKSVIPELNHSIDKLKSKLLKPHPFADRACILELRPGAGGHEADIFTQDLLEMYVRYCQLHNWHYEIISRTDHESGNGVMEATLSVNEPGSYERLRHEAGVHRVQRIPETETKGRLQTSAAGVVVLPKIDDNKGDSQSRKFAPGELRIDVMRASGAGGQHVNKTESAVRIIHIPTGIIVRIQDDRSQHRNKERAFEVLRARLAAKEMKEKAKQDENARTGQVSSVDRSDKIRTYNFQQNRVTDHRCNFTLYDLEGCLNGSKLDDLIDRVAQKEVDEKAEALIEELKEDENGARKAAKAKDYNGSEKIYWAIINCDPLELELDSVSKREKLVESKESSIIELGKLYQEQKNADKLQELLGKARDIMRGSFAKSKTAKVIRTLIDLVETIGTDNALDLTAKITQECIDWSVEEKRTFLRQSLQVRLAGLLYKKSNYQDALSLIRDLVKEFRKLDDKSSLVEVQLLEAKTYFQLKNFAKSRASLTSSRTSANAIYCPSNVQAELDLMSGILHAEDKDFKTGYSYFYEAFENYQLHVSSEENDSKLVKVLKYMLLCKIMIGSIDDVNKLLNNKNLSEYSNNKEIEAMKAVSVAHSHRSLKELEDCLKTYNKELTQDVIIRSHLSDLYDSLFQQNLLKLIEPYSCIEISHICSMIGLPKNVIESKLSNMILDKVFYGVLDQGNGYLIIYSEPKKDKTYDLSLEIIKNMSNVVDLLYEKASSLD